MADITLTAEIVGTDEAVEKARRLVALLQEAQQIIAGLNETDLVLNVT